MRPARLARRWSRPRPQWSRTGFLSKSTSPPHWRRGGHAPCPRRRRSRRPATRSFHWERSSRPPAGAAVASPRPAPSFAGSNRLPLADALIDIGLGDAWSEIGDELVLAHLLARRRFVDGLEGELAQFFRLVADRAVDRAVLDRRDRQL